MKFFSMLVIIAVFGLAGCAKPLTKEELEAARIKAEAQVEADWKKKMDALQQVKVPVYEEVEQVKEVDKKTVDLKLEPTYDLEVAWYREFKLRLDLASAGYSDSRGRTIYDISVNQFDQKSSIENPYSTFKVEVINHCDNVYRVGNKTFNEVMISTKVDGEEVPHTMLKNSDGSMDFTHTSFTLTPMSVIPGQSGVTVLPLIPLDFFKKESGVVEIGFYDIPSCDHKKRENRKFKYKYIMKSTKLYPPSVESAKIRLRQNQVRPYSDTVVRKLKYKELYYGFKDPLVTPNEKMELPYGLRTAPLVQE